MILKLNIWVVGGGMSGCGVQPCIENSLALYFIFVETRLPAYSSSHLLYLWCLPALGETAPPLYSTDQVVCSLTIVVDTIITLFHAGSA